MMRIVRLSLLTAAATALVACGSGPKLGGGKEGAAKALFETSQASNKGLQRAATGQGLPIYELASRAAADGLGEATLDCAQGGKFKVRIDLLSVLQSEPGSGRFKFEVEFDECNEDGANELDGKLAVEFSLVASSSSAEISLKFKGKVEINGEVDDYIDVDVTQIVSAVSLGQSAGSVTVTLTGTIETSEETYTYDGTPLSVTVEGALPVADEGKP